MPPHDGPFWAHPAFWAFAVAFLPFALCGLLYGFRSPWYASGVGRSMMALYAVISGVLGYALVVQVIPASASVVDAVRAVTMGAVALAGCLQLASIVHYQRRRRPPLDRRSGRDRRHPPQEGSLP